MTRVWVVAQAGPGGALTKASAEIATLARDLATAAGGEASGIVVGSRSDGSATDLARYVPHVVEVLDDSLAGVAWSVPAAERVAAVVGDGRPAFILVGADPDGRDLAGALSALLGLGVLANASSVGWSDGPVVEMSVFGGRLLTSSGFIGAGGIVTVEAGAVAAQPAPAAGRVEQVTLAPGPQPAVAIRGHEAASGGAISLEEARVIVSGGRGVGGPEGFALVRELAGILGGAVAASRAAVDSGWIPYSHQVGQTGRIVKPALYLALGISGAIQHKVGMQSSGTIVAVNRDPDAPIAEFADLLVLGDLFEVVPALVAELRTRTG
jgi:electron transfer flavoprotein alpha subunit